MIEFDKEKRRKNKAKHGIDLADAVRFDFDTAIEIDVTDMREDGEERMMATGWLDERLCTIIYTERGGSSRCAGPADRRCKTMPTMKRDGRTPESRARARAAAEAMTDAEDAAIRRAAADDPDTVPADGFVMAQARRGRPPLPEGKRKKQVTMLLDPDVLDALKKDGKGWQTRANAALRKAVLGE